MAAEAKLPGGRGKPAIPVKQAEDQQLTGWMTWWNGTAPTAEQRQKYAALTAAVQAELQARAAPKQQRAAAPPKQAPPPKEDALALVQAEVPSALELHDPASVSARFAKLKEHCHLVTPAAHVDYLPEGFGVSVSFVSANPDSGKQGPGDVYSTGSKVGLAGHVIQQIGAALGAEPNHALSGRLDDKSDPRYCHYRWVGSVRNFDGSMRQISGEVEIDMREGSDQVAEIRSKAERRREQYPNDRNDGGDSQIQEIRKFILRHAETKAMLRAIARGVGMKRSYSPQELRKPFAIARLSFTGQTEDPELRKEFALMNARAAIYGVQALYAAAPVRALPAAAAEAEAHAPPPIGGVADAEVVGEEDEDDFEPMDADRTGAGATQQEPLAERDREPGEEG